MSKGKAYFESFVSDDGSFLVRVYGRGEFTNGKILVEVRGQAENHAEGIKKAYEIGTKEVEGVK